MSSFRKSIPQRTHHERPQLIERRKLGILEKHKDYVLRAQNNHKKEKIIQNLRKKARFKNDDEFYFAMINNKTKDGVHVVERKNLTDEEKRLMESQDLNYIRTMRHVNKKQIKRLELEDHTAMPELPNTHVVFEGTKSSLDYEISRRKKLAETPIAKSRMKELQKRLKRERKMQKVEYEMILKQSGAKFVNETLKIQNERKK